MECGEELPPQITAATAAVPPTMPPTGGFLATPPVQPPVMQTNDNADIETAASERMATFFGQASSGSEDDNPHVSSTSTAKTELTTCDPPNEETKKLPIVISYATNRLFHEGANFILEIRIHSTQASILEARTWLNVGIGNENRLLSLESKKDKRGYHCYTNFYLPGKKENVPMSGEALVKGYVFCVLPNEIQYYEFDVRHAIIALGQDKNTIVNNYTLNGGSLIKVYGSIVNNAASGEDLIKNINHEDPLFKGIKFDRTDWRPEDFWMADQNQYEKPGDHDELTLEYDGLLIHVLSKDDISIGRFKDNDIALVDFVENRAYDQYPTVSVSRHHAILHHNGNGLVLENLSNDGTGIDNGRKTIQKGQTASLSSLATTLDFGAIRLCASLQMCRQKMQKNMCANCMGHPIKSLILTRADNLPEIFVCVWQCCELEAISPDLKGFTLYRRNGGFMLQTPSEKIYNLELDLELEEDGREIKVIH
ncbi:MAG: FHA domain-containing protein [Victivallales bacterium]|nr:FHA domain-containing protein [Victivallales bacterium]